MHAIIIGGLNCSYDVPYRKDYFRAASVNTNLLQGSVIVACDENPERGSPNEYTMTGVALGMAHSIEARGLEERVAEIDYRESSQPERALREATLI